MAIDELSNLDKSVQHFEKIELENLTVEPLYQESSKKIHPAIGTVEDIAYIGVSLPCLVTYKEKSKKKGQPDKTETKEQNMPFLITSKREKLLCSNEVLRSLKWKIIYQSCFFEGSWSVNSIIKFLDGEIVEPAKIYEDVKNAWKTYIEFADDSLYDLLTLWTIGTYCHCLFNTYPYIFFHGFKRTGKSKALTVASQMSFNSVFSGNISTSSLFRLIQSGRCTVLMDETEGLNNPERRQDFRSLLLSGYKRGAVVYRTEKKDDKLVPEPFEIFSPKMIANISGLEDVLEDRTILVVMLRGKNPKVINSEPSSEDSSWQSLRDKLHIFFLCHFGKIQELYVNFSEACVPCVCYEGPNGEEKKLISDRDLELWKPILTLAQFFSLPLYGSLGSQGSQGSLIETIKTLASKTIEQKQTEDVTETGDYVLINTLLELVNESKYYSTKTIKDLMAVKYDENQDWLNTSWVGRAMKRARFFDKRRVGTGVEYKLEKQQVEEVASRLGIKIEPKKNEALLNPKEKWIHSQCKYFNPEKCIEISNSKGGSCTKCPHYPEIILIIHNPPEESEKA